MRHAAPAPAALRDLQAAVRGRVIRAGDVDYDDARRIWNGRVDRCPAVIVRCADVADTVTAVRFARAEGLRIAVRGGGHSLGGSSVCDDGIVIDLSGMKAVQIDPAKRTARAQSGLRLAEFLRATQAHGLATTTGTVGGTGLAGLTLGGGLGWFMGKYGLTIDNLLSVDLVTAAGRVLTASATEHSDLFWGVRGGGGNFGIATAFEFQLHQIGRVLAGKLIFPLDRAVEVLRIYRDITAAAPDELTAYASLTTTPAGQPVIALNLCYCGPVPDGERLLASVRQTVSPLADQIRPKSYLDVIARADAGAPPGRHYDERALTFTRLSDEVIDAIAEAGAALTSPHSIMLIQHLHGAASRVSPAATAFALREESYVMCLTAAWQAHEASQAYRHIAWARAWWTALRPYARSGVYVNFLNADEEGRVRASYGPNYNRLVALKNTYDPANCFSLNHNIKPSVDEPCAPASAQVGVSAIASGR